MSVFVRTAVAGLATAAAITAAPMALADPPAEPVNTEQAPSTPGRLAPPVGEIPASKDGVPPLQPIAAPEGSILDVGVLPLFEEAHWKNVPQWDWGSPFLTGVEVCSPNGEPDPNAEYAAPRSDVQHVILAPGDNGNPQGWTATVSFAPYASLNDSIGALVSYKNYVDSCPLRSTNPDVRVERGGGIVRNDPVNAHGVVVTNDHYMELFATALDTGIIELALTHPTDQGQVNLNYSPRNIIASLRGAVVRPPEPGPFGGWGH